MPDLIDGIEEEFKKLEDVMVQPSKKAAMETAAAFEEALQITKENLRGRLRKGISSAQEISGCARQGRQIQKRQGRASRSQKEMKGLTHDMEEAGKQAEDFNKAIGNVLGKVGGKTGNILQGLGEALFGTDKNGAPNQINGWLSSLFGGDSESGGLGKMIADQLGMSLDEATAAVNEYGASVIHVSNHFKRSARVRRRRSMASRKAPSRRSAHISAARPAASSATRSAMSSAIFSVAHSAGSRRTLRRKPENRSRNTSRIFLQRSIFRAIGKDGKLEQIQNIIFGSSDRFNDPGWVDQFKKYGDEAMNVFGGLGVGLTKVLGIAEDIGPQIGPHSRRKSQRQSDNARLLFQSLGISVQQYEDALVAAGDAGQMSWHEVEVALQGVYAASQPGLVGIGKFEDAFQQLIDSGGRGNARFKRSRTSR